MVQEENPRTWRRAGPGVDPLVHRLQELEKWLEAKITLLQEERSQVQVTLSEATRGRVALVRWERDLEIQSETLEIIRREIHEILDKRKGPRRRAEEPSKN